MTTFSSIIVNSFKTFLKNILKKNTPGNKIDINKINLDVYTDNWNSKLKRLESSYIKQEFILLELMVFEVVLLELGKQLSSKF